MYYIPLLLPGICLIILGISNIKGDLSSIHWYNRTKITPENARPYGKIMGLGTIIMGSALTITAILQMIWEQEIIWCITIIGIVVGLICMVYGQCKYNKGLF